MNAPRPRPRPRPRPWYRTAPRRRLLRRLPESRSARALVVLCAALLAAATIAALASLWYGTPYPQSDPDRIAVRLKDQAQRAYDEAALGGRPEVELGRVEHVDARWYRETGTYTVSAYAGCGKLPDGFYEYTWPERDWAPAAVPGEPVTPPAARSATRR
ncbi:hypothetical protein [Streptomyces parvus]|uniref:hypothetical protein n=1 Tax=Streptomyces parvus TaxID=66428 RepID=UPI0033301E64